MLDYALGFVLFFLSGIGLLYSALAFLTYQEAKKGRLCSCPLCSPTPKRRESDLP